MLHRTCPYVGKKMSPILGPAGNFYSWPDQPEKETVDEDVM